MCKHEMPERGHCLRCGCEVCAECALPGELGPTCGPCVDKERAADDGCPGYGGVDVDTDVDPTPGPMGRAKARKVPAPQPRDGYHGEEPDPLRPPVGRCPHGVLDNTVCLNCVVASRPF